MDGLKTLYDVHIDNPDKYQYSKKTTFVVSTGADIEGAIKSAKRVKFAFPMIFLEFVREHEEIKGMQSTDGLCDDLKLMAIQRGLIFAVE